MARIWGLQMQMQNLHEVAVLIPIAEPTQLPPQRSTTNEPVARDVTRTVRADTTSYHHWQSHAGRMLMREVPAARTAAAAVAGGTRG
jgi:hypothetical protein